MKRKKIKTLIVAAYQKELVEFVDLGRSYQKIEGDRAYLAAGIGPVAATFGLTHFLEDYEPEHIFAIGTAGILALEGFLISDLVVAKSVLTTRQMPSLDYEVYVPDLQKSVLNLAYENLPISELKPVKVLAPQEISKGANWRETLASYADVEHLESFAYAFVAQKFKIPLTLVLGLTNFVGPNANAEWRANEAHVMKKIYTLLKDKI